MSSIADRGDVGSVIAVAAVAIASVGSIPTKSFRCMEGIIPCVLPATVLGKRPGTVPGTVAEAVDGTFDGTVRGIVGETANEMVVGEVPETVLMGKVAGLLDAANRLALAAFNVMSSCASRRQKRTASSRSRYCREARLPP